ncbi:MAG: hypothetical protein ISR86_13630 [Nitrospinaceae bacterium]|nr:hypothetical protein [Nitrospinaceae bacterium]
MACQGVLEEGNPVGPSTSTLRIIPSTAVVTTGASLTFKPLGGTTPFSWTSSNLNIGTIIVDTGIFTAGATPGSITITALDAVGNTATASVTVPGLPLTFDVAGATQVAADATDLITVTANGSGVGFTTTIANNNTGSTFILLPTTVTTGTTITITAPATLPTAIQGDQTYTITVTDASNTNTGTLTYVFQSA